MATVTNLNDNLRTIADYIYFRFYKLIEYVSFGISKPQYRAAGLFSLILFFNLLTILELVGIEVGEESIVIIIPFVLIWYFIWLRFFLSPVNFRNAMKRFKNEGLLSKILGLTFTIIYCIASLIILVKIKSLD